MIDAKIFDGLCGVTAGVLRSRGRQSLGALLNFVCYYIIGKRSLIASPSIPSLMRDLHLTHVSLSAGIPFGTPPVLDPVSTHTDEYPHPHQVSS